MDIRPIAAVALLLYVGSTYSAEPASGVASAQAGEPRFNNLHCDAYRNSMTSVRTPKDFGTVVLRFEVSPQGEVTGSEIEEHTTTTYFAHVAQENFSKCHFDPAIENGQPVKGHQVLRLVFSAHSRVPNDAVCPTPFTRNPPPSVGPMATTKVRVLFTKAGRVASVDVLQASGIASLDEAAVKAYLQCHFDPDAVNQPTFQEEWVTTLNWSS
jgi:TonB family protein